jgi:hypothetical protein
MTHIQRSHQRTKERRKGIRAESTGGSFATTIRSREQLVDSQFKKSLQDKPFKESLALFLADEWKVPDYCSILGLRTLYATAKEKCYKFTVADQIITRTEMPELRYSLEEVDQRIIFHANHASTDNPTRVIILQSPDTDVTVMAIAACYFKWINASCLVKTGHRSTNAYLNASETAAKLGSAVCKGLVGMHNFTGADCTS